MSEDRPRSFESLAQWCSWLTENHGSEKAIWVVIQKKASKKPGIRYEEAVLEAVAHGWIDGKIRSLSKDEFVQRYTPRGSSSVWSRSNRDRAERLISEGRMTPAGLKAVEEARRNGRWDEAYSASRGPVETPPDLIAALKGSEQAHSNFESFPPSARLMYVYWINEAKREETRERRIRTVVIRSEQNLRPGIDLRVIRD